jgi:hypothetical protein
VVGRTSSVSADRGTDISFHDTDKSVSQKQAIFHMLQTHIQKNESDEVTTNATEYRLAVRNIAEKAKGLAIRIEQFEYQLFDGQCYEIGRGEKAVRMEVVRLGSHSSGLDNTLALKHGIYTLTSEKWLQ